ncbi:MAG: DegV family EDD domain-containing protein, partial [Oscillospiraceae bacterium]|nr:DegV family EDD domain-containing protein [Oscillospiraceae bacterium]
MAKVQILADTCCDLTKEQREKYGIFTVPLYVSLGEKMYRDGVDVEPQMLFDYFSETQQTPKTSATTVGDYMDFFKPFVDDGKDIVYIGLSEKMSCTMANARMAAEQFEDAKIFCVDSMNLSTGIGLLVIHAAEMAQSGASAEEIVASLEEIRSRVRASFVLDTLEYLHRGGRCSLLAAVGGKTNAKRVALIHLTFNAIGAVLFTASMWMFKGEMVKLLTMVFPSENTMSVQMRVSLFHVIFNVTNAL